MGFRRRITVEGLNLARFIRMAGASGVPLMQLRRNSSRRLTAVVDEAHLAQLHQLAEEGGWMLTDGCSVGAGRVVRRAVSRWALLGMMIIAGLLTVIASRMMWRVEIEGAGAYEADVLMALREAGITTPLWRKSVDAAGLRDMLEWRYPDVAWIECGWRGMTLHIRFVEGIQDGEESDEGACDVTAARDGVVVRIVTRAGTPVVSVGDLVQKGDVLIRGEERSSGETVRPVVARGSVYARVWASASVCTPLRVTETIPTGRSTESIYARSPWFALWRTEPSGYAHEDISRKEMPLGGFFWPLTVCYEERIETDLQSVITDYRSVLDENNRAAELELAKLPHEGESLVDNWVNWSIIEDEILLSVATGEYVADIAQQERSSGMAAPE